MPRHYIKLRLETPSISHKRDLPQPPDVNRGKKSLAASHTRQPAGTGARTVSRARQASRGERPLIRPIAASENAAAVRLTLIVESNLENVLAIGRRVWPLVKTGRNAQAVTSPWKCIALNCHCRCSARALSTFVAHCLPQNESVLKGFKKHYTINFQPLHHGYVDIAVACRSDMQ